MNKTFLTKTIFLLLVLLLVFSSFAPLIPSVKAVSVGGNASLQSIGEVPKHLKIKPSGNYITTSIVGYYENGQFYPAYCLEKDKPGAEKGAYDVTLEQVLANDETYNKIWRVLVNGYPYNSPESMGIYSGGEDNWKYAFQATKMAVYCVLGQSNIDNIYGDDAIGQEIKSAITNLVNKGINGTDTYMTPAINITEQGEFNKEKLNGKNYFVKNYNVETATHSELNYTVAIPGLPEGTKILNDSNTEQTSYTGSANVKVAIPETAVTEQSITGRIEADMKVKSFPVLAGYCNNDVQRYAVTRDPFETIQNVLPINIRKVEVNKLAKDDNEITGDKAGTPLSGTRFNIYDINHKLLHKNLTTDEKGKIDVLLSYGKYIVEEVRPPEFYLLSNDEKTNQKIIEVREQGDLISLDFENESVKLGLIIEKTGLVQTQPNDEIIYNFPQLRNDSNVSLNDFTWSDVLPTDYIKATKLYTGTYNEDLNYSIYYKTNLSGDTFKKFENDKTEDGTFNTKTNNYIDFTKVQNEGEYVTEWKVEFGTVKAGFEAEEKPFMFAKVNSTVQPNDMWTNHTFLEGKYTSIDGKEMDLGSKDDWTTTSYGHELSISKLPKTGF